MYGDANQDGKLDLKDATTALKIALGIEATPEGNAFTAVDVDKDNKISLSDVTLILKAALGIITF